MVASSEQGDETGEQNGDMIKFTRQHTETIILVERAGIWCVWLGMCFTPTKYSRIIIFNADEWWLQWDLGEFDQKHTVPTRWGSKDELLAASAKCRELGIDILIDAVLNVKLYFGVRSETIDR
jgi:hypothetical protein